MTIAFTAALDPASEHRSARKLDLRRENRGQSWKHRVARGAHSEPRDWADDAEDAGQRNRGPTHKAGSSFVVLETDNRMLGRLLGDATS